MAFRGLQIKKDFYFSIGILSLIFLLYVIFLLIKPSVAINTNEEYTIFHWILSLSFLVIPIFFFVFSKDFKEGKGFEKFLWLSLSLFLCSIVHKPRLYIDAQFFFFVASLIYFYKSKRQIYKPSVFSLLFVVYFLWNLTAVFWSAEKSTSFQLINRLVPFISFPIFFLFFRLDDRLYVKMLKIFWQVSIIACLLSFLSIFYECSRMGISVIEFVSIQKKAINEIPVYNYIFSWSGTNHPSYNAIWIIASLVISFFLFKKKCIGLFSLLFTTVLFFILLTAMQSRIGIVMLVLVLFLGLLYINESKKWRYGILSSFLLLMIFIIYTKFSALCIYFFDPIRIDLYKISIDYIQQKMLLGSGVGGMNSVEISQVIGRSVNFPWDFYPHNQFLGDWIQSGVFCVIILLIAYVCIIFESIKKKNFLMFSFAFSMLLFMQIEMPFRFLGGSTMFVFFLLLFSIAPHNRES